MVNALEICQQLKESVGDAAYKFYSQKLGVAANLKRIILERGGTNFDQKHFPDDPSEKPFYKTDLYIWQYMDMHIKQNLVVLRKYLDHLIGNSCQIMFIDLGCGPMTSGLALAEIISNKNIVYYLGIDDSKNMVKSAQWINDNYQIFDPDRFRIMQNQTFHPKMMAEWPLAKNVNNIVILSMSFVLAPNTNKAVDQASWTQNLAQTWNQWAARLPNLSEIRAIYMNPDSDSLHKNWDEFQKALKESSVFSYTGRRRGRIDVPNLRQPVIAAQMIGVKK